MVMSLYETKSLAINTFSIFTLTQNEWFMVIFVLQSFFFLNELKNEKSQNDQWWLHTFQSLADSANYTAEQWNVTSEPSETLRCFQ